MNIDEALEIAKEICTWVHGQTNNSQVANDRRTVMAVSAFQHVLDIADGIVVLVDNKLSGVALTLARSLHEGYTQSVWLLNCASDEQLDNFSDGICPKLQTLVKEIGDEPETGGAFIKRMTEKNIRDFNNLTHGGIEHISRHNSDTAIEPNYSNDDIMGLLKARNQYYLLTAFFLLSLMGREKALEELNDKWGEWSHAL